MDLLELYKRKAQRVDPKDLLGLISKTIGFITWCGKDACDMCDIRDSEICITGGYRLLDSALIIHNYSVVITISLGISHTDKIEVTSVKTRGVVDYEG